MLALQIKSKRKYRSNVWNSRDKRVQGHGDECGFLANLFIHIESCVCALTINLKTNFLFMFAFETFNYNIFGFAWDPHWIWFDSIRFQWFVRSMCVYEAHRRMIKWHNVHEYVSNEIIHKTWKQITKSYLKSTWSFN